MVQETVNQKIAKIEEEIENLRALVASNIKYSPSEKTLVSLRGKMKTDLSGKELDNYIEEAKKSLFRE